MTLTDALETAIAAYLATIEELDALPIVAHIAAPGDPRPMPLAVVTAGDLIEDELLLGVYRGPVAIEIQAHAQDASPATIAAWKAEILDALRCEAALAAYLADPPEEDGWPAVNLRYARASDRAASEMDGAWVAGVELEVIAHL